jgi:hypothetical protein
VAHHVRRHYWGSGTGIKPHDYCTIPLCTAHHDAKNEKMVYVEVEIIQNLQRYLRKKYDGFVHYDINLQMIDHIDKLMKEIEGFRS